MNSIREDAHRIIQESIKEVLPDSAVDKALKDLDVSGKDIYVLSIGKAAWTMAKAAADNLGPAVKKGLVVTKYDHSNGPITNFEIVEAGHPIPDENSIAGASKALEMVQELTEDDLLLFLISGGGSAVFEKPLEGISLNDIIYMTDQLLCCGAEITEINAVRKHLSAVKGGRLAQQCDGRIYSIVLSDVIGDRFDAIASGPACPDSSTSEEAIGIVEKYNICIDEQLIDVLRKDTPKKIENVESVISGSVSELCQAAAKCSESLGYEPLILSSSLECEAKEAGKFFASVAKEIKEGKYSFGTIKPPCAVIAGGETVVRIYGNGKGGRNQELALSAALGIEGVEDVVIFSVGSDGTDGPTDAAGGIVDGRSAAQMRKAGKSPEVMLDYNDSYHALKASGDLIMTGATGTNVNDLMVVLCR